MRRDSVRTARNFSPARKVLSITAPSAERRSLVRTKAPPLPGLTCWNSRTLKTVPSTSMWLPFLSWFVMIVATRERVASWSEQAVQVLGDCPGVLVDLAPGDADDAVAGGLEDAVPRAVLLE